MANGKFRLHYYNVVYNYMQYNYISSEQYYKISKTDQIPCYIL